MRSKFFVVALVALAAICTAFTSPASAFGWHRHEPPHGWGRTRAVRHWVYYPRYAHHYYVHRRTDPYAYRYEPRGYYPYYGSGYWRPSRRVRRHRGYRAPRYYPAWGHYKRRWRHRRWHNRHHGGHPFWQW